MPYPVEIGIEIDAAARNRWTVAFRPVLAIPHSILVGPLFWTYRTGGVGLIGAVAYVMAVFSWVMLLANGSHPAGIRKFSRYYLRWRARSLAYMALFVDRYPPFGDDAYPASIKFDETPSARDRLSIAFRVFLGLPHLVALCVLMVGLFLTTVWAWLSILIGGRYPIPVLPFSSGVVVWMLRVETYMLLLTDEFPPFSLK